MGLARLTRPTNRRPPDSCHTLAAFIYAAIKITVLLLAAGTFLGALWADKAWGHFWSWDSKEVWALVSLLVYAFFLHLRHLGWSRDFGMALTAVFGFTAILFTYYGVNFVLGTGMHSYGSGAGGLWAVTAAVAFEWLFLAAAAGRYLGELRYVSSASGNGSKRPVEYPQRIGDRHAVVADRHAGPAAGGHAREHLAAVPHACPAVDHEPIVAQIVRKIVPLGGVDPQLAADVLRQPAGNLHPADVVADRVMRTGLGHQHAVAGPQPLDGQGPFDELPQIALLPREKN